MGVIERVIEKRLTLRVFHHQRCLHAGLLRVTGSAPQDPRFELGLRTGGSPLVRAPQR